MTNDLRVLPFFQPFEDSALHTTNVMLQMSYALRSQLLADAIPAPYMCIHEFYENIVSRIPKEPEQ